MIYLFAFMQAPELVTASNWDTTQPSTGRVPGLLVQESADEPVVSIVWCRLEPQSGAKEIVDVDIFHGIEHHAAFEGRSGGDQDSSH